MRKRKKSGLSKKLDRKLLEIANWRWQFLRRNKQFQEEQPSTFKHYLDLIEKGESAEADKLRERFINKWWVYPSQSFWEEDFDVKEHCDAPLLGRVTVESADRAVPKRPLRLLVSIPFYVPHDLVREQLKEIIRDKTMILEDPLLSGKERTLWISKFEKKIKLYPIQVPSVDDKEKRLRLGDYKNFIKAWDLRKAGKTHRQIARIIYPKISYSESLRKRVMRCCARAKDLINGGYRTLSL